MVLEVVTRSDGVVRLWPRSPISTNAHLVGKSLRLAQKFFAVAACSVGTRLRWPDLALKHPNAHRVGKNDRPAHKKFFVQLVVVGLSRFSVELQKLALKSPKCTTTRQNWSLSPDKILR